MKKHFLISQPPLTEKYSFLVDDINQFGNWGVATDIDKIEYNRNLLDDDFNIDIKIKMLFTQKGMTFVVPIGRFITIVKIRADEKEGSMTFLDFDTGYSRGAMEVILEEAGYSVSIVNDWLKYYDFMLSEFSAEQDNVVLLKPDESGFL
jgi:hypothetical protein